MQAFKNKCLPNHFHSSCISVWFTAPKSDMTKIQRKPVFLRIFVDKEERKKNFCQVNIIEK